MRSLLPCFTILEDSNSFVFITAFHRTLWITLHSVYNCYLREKIRDADKLDNCRVKLVDSVEAMIGVPQEHAGEGKISPKVWESCLRKEAVSSPDRITSVDYWVSYAAQYYDLNFKETWRIMKEKDYISRIIKRLEYKEKDTREKMEILEQQMNAYMEKILC